MKFVIEEHLHKGEKYFEPTPGWDKDQSVERLWRLSLIYYLRLG